MFAANFIPAPTNRCSLGEHELGKDYGPLVSHIGAPENRECVYHTQCLANRVIDNACPECGLALNANSIEKFKAKVKPLYEELKRAQEQLESEIKKENEDRDLAYALSVEDSEGQVGPIEQQMPFSEEELAAAQRAQERHDSGRAGQQGRDNDIGLSREERIAAEQNQRQYDQLRAAGNGNLAVLGLNGLSNVSRRCPSISTNQLNVIIWSAVVIAFVARNYF